MNAIESLGCRYAAALFIGLLLTAASVSTARGQVFPIVDCVEPAYQIGTVNMTASAAIGDTSISVDGLVPVGSALVINAGSINPGSSTEERVTVSGVSGSNPYVLTINALTKAHAVGQSVRFEFAQFTAFFGYNNINSGNITLLKGGFNNFFTPGSNSYPGQPSVFLPGVYHRVFSITLPSASLTWILQGNSVSASNNSAQYCSGGAITYQGRLSDANAAANGQYDLQFSLFDASTAGTQQGGNLVIENTQVTGGVFTVQLDVGAALNPSIPLYLAIGVRPGSGTGNDPFTTLSPRQPLTAVPLAIRAQTAVFALNAANSANATTATTGFSVGGGSLSLNDNMLRLRTSIDGSHGLLYSSAVDGIEFRGGGGFRWMTGTNGATERMRLDSAGNLTVAGNLSAGGIVTGKGSSLTDLNGSNIASGTIAETRLGLTGATYSGRINGLSALFSDFGAANGTSTANATESNVWTLSPNRPCMAQNLSVKLDVAPGGASVRVFFLNINGAASTVSCSIPGSGTVCSTSQSAVVPAGSTLSIKEFQPQGPGSSTVALFGWECR